MIAQLKIQHFLFFISLYIGWLLPINSTAIANSWPPMAVPLFYLPLIASIFSFGIGFFLIIFLEGWIIARRENLRFWHSIWLVTVANILSTIAGVGVVFSLTGLGFGLFSWVLWMILAPLCLGVGVCTAGTLKHFTKLWSGNFLIWSIVWLVIFLGELLLISFVNASTNTVLKFLAAAIYFTVGFILSIAVEGFWLSRNLSEKTTTLGKTVVIANLRSYAYIAIPITIALLVVKK